MVFFNYSTMQMAAKVVYYGPGLCGKTTNLQYIYNHTSSDSRGEMVSLETETDRTLFFDLLPIDVGTIAGFHTRIQLYTVPGQVFYNTTRKLVLKGVDGVVFVADSQRPMLQSNIESLKNLEENLAELQLSLDTLPIVLQYNKRDLPDVVPVEELNRVLNPKGWPYFEASAVKGIGVFETLKGISKLTLASLKKRLGKGEGERQQQPAGRPGGKARAMISVPPRSSVPSPAAATASPPLAAKAPAPSPPPAPVPPLSPPPAPKPKAGKEDVLAQLEQLRREALSGAGGHSRPAAPPPTPPISAKPAAAPPPAPTSSVEVKSPASVSGAHPKGSANGQGEIHRSIELTLRRPEYQKARRFLLNLKVEDENHRVVDAIRDLPIEIADPTSLERVQLSLNVAIKPKD